MIGAIAANPQIRTFRLPGGWDILLMYLLMDGLIVQLEGGFAGYTTIDGLPVTSVYAVTPAGREFVRRWAAAEPVSPEAEPTESATAT